MSDPYEMVNNLFRDHFGATVPKAVQCTICDGADVVPCTLSVHAAAQADGNYCPVCNHDPLCRECMIEALADFEVRSDPHGVGSEREIALAERRLRKGAA